MRVVFIPPTENDFKQLFLSLPLRKGGGLDDISLFQPSTSAPLRYRKGSGIFSFISKVAKRVLPFLIKASNPAAKEFGSAVIKDIMEGKTPTRKSLKMHGVKALKQMGLRLIKGSGRLSKKKRKFIKRGDVKKKKKKFTRGYKRDIFDMF